MTKNLPTLYSFRRCPYAMRARLALAFAKKDYLLREVDLKNKPKHMLEISPKGTVPVLFGPSLFIEESLDIVSWAMKENPDAFDLSSDTQNFVKRLASEFIPSLNKYKYPDRYDLEDGSAFKADLEIFLDDLENTITTPYIYGDKPSFTDIALFPLIRQMRIVDEHDFDNMDRPNVLSWMQHFLTSLQFEKIMKKHDVWDENNPQEIYVSF